jgi:hypothetical protein
MKRALLCGCRRLEASDAQKLVSEVLAHLRREHPAEEYGEARVRERIAAHSYRYRPISSAPRARLLCARAIRPVS